MPKFLKNIIWFLCCQCKSCEDSIEMDLMDI